jgi:hypothetical protein
LLLEKFPEANEATENLVRACGEGDFSELSVSCYICKSAGHVSTRCKKVLINFDHEEIKQRWI